MTPLCTLMFSKEYWNICQSGTPYIHTANHVLLCTGGLLSMNTLSNILGLCPWSGLWYDPVSALVSFPDSWHQTRLPQLSLVMCLRDYPACGLRVRFQIVCLVEGCVSHCKAIVRTLPPGSFLRDREKWPKKRPQVCYPQEKTVLWLTWIGELLSGSPSSYVTIPKIWVGSDHARLLI